VITVLTSPFPEVDGVAQPFSCAWNCHYCPAEPGQPRSYLHDEPAVRRANQNAFDPVLQFTDRAATLLANGHPVDKIELLVLGGTWASYPHAYQEAFCRDLFYAANTFAARGAARRQRLSLAEEQAANEAAECKIIGLTLETRPDTINADELRRLRRYGCTRVQLGVQHTDDAVLRKVNRGCSTAATRRALRLLKDTCYKVDVHLMPNLPGATLEADEAMFTAMLDDPGLQADQWKIYPCEVLPWTKVKEWFDAGEFVPYADDALFELILRVKARMHPWIRLNRVIRDIPSQYILGGVDAPNMRQTLAEHLAARGLACPCIRCREVGADSDRKAGAARLRRRDYAASDGQEIFLSFETPDAATIFGFARLRLTSDPGSGVFPALRGAALIRELHVYGQLVPTAPAGGGAAAAQHTGFGRALMAAAEDIAAAAGATSVAVIAGIGARNYYRKLGYEVEDDGGFMIKAIPAHQRLLARVRLAAPRAAALLPFVPLLAALLLLVLHLMFPAAESDHGGLAEL
jgi:ELP3 family radical SAM enzyme/protein acetyltransferase